MYSLILATEARKSFLRVWLVTESLPRGGARPGFRDGSGQALLQPVQPLFRIRVRRCRFLAPEIGRHDELDLLAHVVEGQHLVEKHETGIRDAEIVFASSGRRSSWRTAS